MRRSISFKLGRIQALAGIDHLAKQLSLAFYKFEGLSGKLGLWVLSATVAATTRV
jgi:hypothetical protein